MPDKPPIPLDYKTPEKGERVNAGTIIWRVIAGMCGMFALMFAVAFTAVAIGSLASAISNSSLEETGGFVIGGIFAMAAWLFTHSWLKYAILGDQNTRQSNLIFKGRNQHINYE